MRRLKPKPPSLRIAVTALILLGSSAGFSACRLGANNSEKLSALKSGQIYDEDGLVSVTISSPSTDTLINVASDRADYSAGGTCAPDGTMVSLQVDGAAETSAAAVACSGGLWSTTFDSTKLAAGEHSLVAVANRNGKTLLSEAVTIRRDVSVPQLAILTPSNGGYINSSTNSATFAVSGTCTESDQTVSVKVDGASATAQNGGACDGTTWAATISTLGLAAGTHTLQVAMTSASGNPSTSETVIVTKDVTAPTAAITAPASGTYIYSATSVANYNISGSCNDLNATVQVQINGTGSGWDGCTGGTNWGQAISTAALSEGTHTLTAVIRDPAGNTSTSSAITITKDVTAPTISISSPATNSYVNLGNNSASFAISGACSGTTESGRSISLQVNGASASQSAISCGAGSTWSGTFSTAALSEANHTLTATLNDVAGNSTTSTAIVLTKDTNRPSVTLTYPVAGSVINPTTNSATFPVKGTCSENTRAVSILVDGSAATGLASNTCSSGAFSATIDTGYLSNAAHTITATQTDAAGNTGPSTAPSVSVTRDTTIAQGGTFARTSVAQDPFTGTQAASGVARYSTVSSATGVLIEEGTTNLVTNSGFESDLTGWLSNGTPTTVVSTTQAFSGTKALKFVGGSAFTDYYYRAVTLSTSTTYTLSFRYKVVTAGTGDVIVGGVMIDNTWPSNSFVLSQSTVSSDWITAKTTFTTPASITSAVIVALRPNAAASGWDIYLDNLQIEQKAYATSWIDGTRSVESLTVPLSGSLQASQGAVVARAYFSGSLPSAGVFRRLFYYCGTPAGSLNCIALDSVSTGFRAVGTNGSGTGSVSSMNPGLTAGWHYFAIQYTSTSLTLWIDGTPATSVSNPNLPASMGTTGYIGSDASALSHWNQPIDSVAFYQHTPTNAEMTTYTTTGPTGADMRLDFAGLEFARTSVAGDYANGAPAASGVARYATVNSKTGILIEESTTNLLRNGAMVTDTSDWTVTNAAGADGAISRVYDSELGAYAIQYTVTNIAAYSFFGNRLFNYISAPFFDTTKSYSLRFKAKIVSGTPTTYMRIQQSDASNVVFNTSNISPGTTWTDYQYTFTPAVTGSNPMVYFAPINAAGTYTIRIAMVQLEQKAYSTSYQEYGTARAAETLTIPTAQIWNPSSMAILARIYVDGDLAAATTAKYHKLFEHVTSITNPFPDMIQLYLLNGTPGTWGIATRTNGGSLSNATWQQQLTKGYHIIGAKLTTAELSLWVDGTKRASVANPNLPSVQHAKSYIGSGRDGLEQWGQPIDWMAFYTTAPSDDDMATYTTSGAAGTALKLDFSNSLGQ